MKKKIIAVIFAVLLFLGLGGLYLRYRPAAMKTRVETLLYEKHDCAFNVEYITFSMSDYCYHGICNAQKDPSVKSAFICSLKEYLFDTWGCDYAGRSEGKRMASLLDQADGYIFPHDNTIPVKGHAPSLDDILYLYPEEQFICVILQSEPLSELYEAIDECMGQYDYLEGELIICQMDESEIAYMERNASRGMMKARDFLEIVHDHIIYRVPL